MSKLFKILFTTFMITSCQVAIADTHKIEDEKIKQYLDNLKNTIYKKTDWNNQEYTKSGISSFAFLDHNGNGKYEIGDTPIKGIGFVLLDSEKNPIIYKQSNLDGYANMYANKDYQTHQKIDIYKPGTYYIASIFPDEFEITTNNQIQEIEIKEFTGSIGNLISEKAPTLTGLKRKLFISGRDSQLKNKTIDFSLNNSQEKKTITADENGFWKIYLPEGKWTATSETFRKEDINLINTSIHINNNDNITDAMNVITFDDIIDGSISVLKIPNGYHNLNWNNWVITHNSFYSGAGYRNGNVSGDYVAYLSSGSPANISSDKKFDFKQGYFSVSFPEAEGELMDIIAYENGKIKYTDTIELSSFQPINFLANYKSIDKIEFKTHHYWQGIADNLDISIIN